MIGQNVGSYRIVRELGAGAMGAVYEGVDLMLERPVAIKMLRAEIARQPELIERFRVEATAAASLRHPHIVAIHEIGEHEGQHYFSMDLVTGRNLDELTRSGPLAARQAAELVATVARAVDYAHRHGVLHRDIKPSNVIVDAEGQPHVTDFGLARRIADSGGLIGQDCPTHVRTNICACANTAAITPGSGSRNAPPAG